MTGDVEVVIEEGRELDRPLVVVGLPTLGVVGTITAQYLVDQLEMPQVGGLYSNQFPPVGRVQGGRSSFPVRLHALESDCGSELRCENLVVGVTEFLPNMPAIYAIAERVTEWAQTHDAGMLVSPDGLLVHGDEGPTIHGVAALPEGLELFEQAGVQPMEEGVLMGFSAATISNGRRLDVNAVSLLAETAPDRPDARAAARLVEVLDPFVPEIDIETEPLLKQAEEIEEHTRNLREQMDHHAEATDVSYAYQ